jgi:hypothetical protein
MFGAGVMRMGKRVNNWLERLRSCVFKIGEWLADSFHYRGLQRVWKHTKTGYGGQNTVVATETNFQRLIV